MNFKVTLSDFKDAIQKVLPAMPRKSTLPVLEHLSFSLENALLKIIASDQDIIIMSSVEVEQYEEGKILVPGYRINEIVKALDKGNIQFISDVETFEIELKTHKGKFKMKGLDEEEYLDIPILFSTEKPSIDESNPPAGRFTKDELSRLADKTFFAVSTDEFRPAMTGVLFQFKGDLVNAVSTDSFRLVKAVCKSEAGNFSNDLDVILPARTVELLRKIDDDVSMSVIETDGKITHVRFDYGNTVLTSRIIDEQFPAYENVIPTDNPFEATIPLSEFLSALRRVSIFASVSSYQVKVRFESNQMKLVGEDEDSGTKGDESLACEYDLEPFSIGFNYRYLDQALQNAEDDIGEDGMIVMSFSEPNRPALIMPKENREMLTMLIMPVKI
jgi:DNA polymerase III subunit beta